MPLKRKLSLGLPGGMNSGNSGLEEESREGVDRDKLALEFISGAETKRKKYTKNVMPWDNIEEVKKVPFMLRGDNILMSKITYFAEKYDISKHKLVLRMINRELKRLEDEDAKGRYYERKEKDI